MICSFESLVRTDTVEVKVTLMHTKIIVRAIHTQNVLGKFSHLFVFYQTFNMYTFLFYSIFIFSLVSGFIAIICVHQRAYFYCSEAIQVSEEQRGALCREDGKSSFVASQSSVWWFKWKGFAGAATKYLCFRHGQ
ncbi:hypothetical protein Ddye_009480 [Dipteronia dyeriana]|uniref:Uncharacterized protein n=1 Tax=Dipteronia dyeriana TaxID=168575 RepID=A0AAE0CMX5_9ROSI|nr:hypothetical protein Ddye_009480 [Dipteronia dyeriana]